MNMENKEVYGKSAVAFVEVPIRDLEKCKQIAAYFHTSPAEALHYVIRKGIECVRAESQEVPDD